MLGAHKPNSSASKGKSRALEGPDTDTERTPLLSSQLERPPEQSTSQVPISEPRHRRSLASRLTIVFLLTLGICMLGLIIIALLAYSYASRASSHSDEVLDRGLVVRGPFHVDVLNTTQEGGIWMKIETSVGVNAGAALGIESDSDDSIFQSVWKSIGRNWIDTLREVTVDLGNITVHHQDDESLTLASLQIPPITIPLTSQPPLDSISWLTNLSSKVYVASTQDSDVITAFARDSWSLGVLSVQYCVSQVIITGGGLGENSWRKRLHIERADLKRYFKTQIPPIPGLPLPGKNIPFPPISDLITLKTFNVTSGDEALNLYGIATIIDPIPDSIDFTAPQLPFIVAIPSADNSSVKVASLEVAPFHFTRPNITLNISGSTLAIKQDSAQAISAFLSKYLTEKPAPILISTPFFPNITVPAFFPPPVSRPDILRNVTIRDMKLKATADGSFVASGMIFARVTLPDGMSIDLSVNRVWPEVLVFDGEVPDSAPEPMTSSQDSLTTISILEIPDPLPEGAFGHIKPDDWLPSISKRIVNSEHGSEYTVTANVTEVPLEILPGRSKEFSNFVSKLVFGSDGATAGILGSAAVSVAVNGIGSSEDLELGGLPFRGSVKVGKKTI